jgi:hypothetical protein
MTVMATTVNFTGSKGGSGVAQWLISLMPPHTAYVEAFLGKGVVMSQKRPALLNIGIEIDLGVLDNFSRRQTESTVIVKGDALAMLPALKTEPTWLIYADPPYLSSTRSCQRAYYRHELLTVVDHSRLLSVLTGLQCMVMLSGYWSELYARSLTVENGWRHSSFWTVNRGGKRVQEFCWMNFPAPARLHDARFAGDNFTDRQRIKRKVARWTNRFAAMPAGEKTAILDALSICGREEVFMADPGNRAVRTPAAAIDAPSRPSPCNKSY